jgi:hypothetical protein
MTNDEIPNDEGMSKSETGTPCEVRRCTGRLWKRILHSSFELHSSLVIGNSSFVDQPDRKVALPR